MYRSSTFREDFCKEMRKPLSRKIFILTLVEDKIEPMGIEDALRLAARTMGTVEFADLVGERKQNVDKFLKHKRKLKRETLDKYLRHFGLQTVLSVKPLKRKRKAA